MKKILCIFLALTVLGLAGCATNSDNPSNIPGTVGSISEDELNQKIMQYKIILEPSIAPENFAGISYGGMITMQNADNKGLRPKYGFMNINGELVVPYIYDKPGDFNKEGLCIVCDINKGWGMIDTAGNIVIPFDDYVTIGGFLDGKIEFSKKDGKYGIMDKNGDIVVPATYSRLSYSGGETCVAGNDDGSGNIKYGIINLDGSVIVPLEYDNISGFQEGLAAVCIDGKYGFIDENLNIVIPCVYDSAGSFDGGLAMVFNHYKNDNWVSKFIDKTGKVIIDGNDYDFIDSCQDGLIRAVKDGKTGFLDMSGNIAIPFEYDDVGNFSNGFALVKKDDSYGYINKSGEILRLGYEEARPFQNGYAVVKFDGKYGIIDTNIDNNFENTVVPYVLDDVSSITEDGFAAFLQNGKYGVLEILK